MVCERVQLGVQLAGVHPRRASREGRAALPLQPALPRRARRRVAQLSPQGVSRDSPWARLLLPCPGTVPGHVSARRVRRIAILHVRGPVAQLVEQGTFNPKVAGSSPARPITDTEQTNAAPKRWRGRWTTGDAARCRWAATNGCLVGLNCRRNTRLDALRNRVIDGKVVVAHPGEPTLLFHDTEGTVLRLATKRRRIRRRRRPSLQRPQCERGTGGCGEDRNPRSLAGEEDRASRTGAESWGICSTASPRRSSPIPKRPCSSCTSDPA